MVNTLDMRDLRYLNLFRKITRIQTRYCFIYNEIVMFCVPSHMISQALGRNGENLKKMSDILKRRIRIVPLPLGIENAESFIQLIIAPVGFKEIEIRTSQNTCNSYLCKSDSIKNRSYLWFTQY